MRWRKVTHREFSGRLDLTRLIKIPGSVDIAKIGNNGATTSDTCNSACKARRLLVEHVANLRRIVHEIDCVQHLQNI